MSHFTLKELLHSDVAQSVVIDNTPTFEAVKGLDALRINVLDVIRAKYGKPVNLSSGFRCAALNEAVGGAPSSQHVANEIYAAADIDQGSREENQIIFDLVQKWCSFDQLIWEGGGSWVHVSYRTDCQNRKKILGT